MRVTIEFDIPEGQLIPDPIMIARLTSPDWVADWWHIDDVREQYDGDGKYSNLTDEQCRQVLHLMSEYKDADVGFNWDFVAECIESITARQI